jgi:nucleotide-binding universal stress UspA family protein
MRNEGAVTTARIRHILCPIDGSEPSLHALRQAVAVAKWSGAHVTVLHVSPLVYATVSEPGAAAAGSIGEDTARLKRLMARSVAKEAGSDIDVEFDFQEGDIVKEILSAVNRLGIDLIVIGTHGVGGFAHLMLGSITEKVLRRAACPVMTVPPRDVDVSRLPFERILCATDFSDCSFKAVEYAMAMAEQAGARVVLAHVVEWPWVEPPPPAFETLPEEQAVALAAFRAHEELRSTERLKALLPAGFEHHCAIRVVHGKPYEQILRVAFEEQADAIVLGVHGRRAVDLALFGSTTNQLVRRAACPVLTLRH